MAYAQEESAVRRTSILIDEATYELLAWRARQNQRSVSEEIRDSLDASVRDYDPNQPWLDLADQFSEFTFKPGPTIDSEEFKEEMAREIYRGSFNREPNW
jgi:hypothetical protein